MQQRLAPLLLGSGRFQARHQQVERLHKAGLLPQHAHLQTGIYPSEGACRGECSRSQSTPASLPALCETCTGLYFKRGCMVGGDCIPVRGKMC